MVLGGGERYVTNVCMYAALFHMYSGTITQIACRREHRRRRRRHRESVPIVSRAWGGGLEPKLYLETRGQKKEAEMTSKGTDIPHSPSYSLFVLLALRLCLNPASRPLH